MRPTPLRKSSEIQSAVERALVEAVLLRQEPQGSPLRSAIQRALKESKTLRPESKRLRRRISVMNTPRPSDVPEIKDFELRQTQDGVIKLQWGRQEDKENICNFLARSLEKSMEAKESEEETINETMAEDEMGAQQETATLAHPEKDEPVTTASASITDADEPQVPREWDAPAIVGAETDQIIDGLPVNEDPPAPEPHGSSHKERNKVLFPNFRGDIRLTDPELKFAVSIPNMHWPNLLTWASGYQTSNATDWHPHPRSSYTAYQKHRRSAQGIRTKAQAKEARGFPRQTSKETGSGTIDIAT